MQITSDYFQPIQWLKIKNLKFLKLILMQKHDCKVTEYYYIFVNNELGIFLKLQLKSDAHSIIF